MKTQNRIEKLFLLCLSLLVLTIISIAFWNFFHALRVIEGSSTCCSPHMAVETLQCLQHKVFDDTVITFLATIVVTLLITIGIYQIKESSKTLNHCKKYLNTFREEKESVSSVATLYQ